MTTMEGHCAMLDRIDQLEAELHALRGKLGGDHFRDGQVDQLGLCGCGAPEEVIDSLARYLHRQRALHADSERLSGTAWEAFVEDLDRTHGFEHRDGRAPLEYWWAAYTADRLELTEHGGSVAGAWLTDKGRTWLANYHAAQNADADNEE